MMNQQELPALDHSLQEPQAAAALDPQPSVQDSSPNSLAPQESQAAAQDSSPTAQSEKEKTAADSKGGGGVAFFGVLRSGKGEIAQAAVRINELAGKLKQQTSYVDPATGETRRSNSVLIGSGFRNDSGTISFLLDANPPDSEDHTGELGEILNSYNTRITLYPQHKGGVTAKKHTATYKDVNQDRPCTVLCDMADGTRGRVGKGYYNDDGSLSIALDTNFAGAAKTGRSWRLMIVPQITAAAWAEKQRNRDSQRAHPMPKGVEIAFD